MKTLYTQGQINVATRELLEAARSVRYSACMEMGKGQAREHSEVVALEAAIAKLDALLATK